MDKWLDNCLEKIVNKVRLESQQLGNAIPYIPYNGRYSDVVRERGIDWWTNGFWGGLQWQLFNDTNQSIFLETAVVQEKRLDQALHLFEDIHHDVGFIWLLTAVAHYRITGDKQAYRTGLHAAELLAGRFNPAGGFLVAWNDHPGWVIIDSMMNIQLLYWASEQTGDPRFAQIATIHADTVADKLVRDDGSVGHIASFNPQTGEFIEQLAGQGITADSAWSRGNAWAIYGFALTYRHTKDVRYLELAQKIATYFQTQLEANHYIPVVDFKTTETPNVHDTSAGVIAACGFLEISTWVAKEKGILYKKNAEKTLKTIEACYADWGTEEDGIIGGGTEAYHRPATYEVPLIYSDYFFTEAILRLKGRSIFLW